jgi:hypothetical protein
MATNDDMIGGGDPLNQPLNYNGGNGSGNWWEGPPPAGYTGPWPPPLGPGQSYGSAPGSVITAQLPNGTPDWQQGVAIPPDHPPDGLPVGPDAKSPFYHPEWYAPNNAPAPPTAPGPGSGGGPGGPTVQTSRPKDPLIPPSDDGTFHQPDPIPGQPGPAPTPNFPTFRPAPAFVEPDYDAALQDKAYQFESNEGRRMLEASAAARGVLNGGGTLKDIDKWGQQFATQRVNDVRDRAVNNYLLNYQTQFVDPYKYAYQNATDTFGGNRANWSDSTKFWQDQNEQNWQHQYLPWNDLWNRRVWVAGQ